MYGPGMHGNFNRNRSNGPRAAFLGSGPQSVPPAWRGPSQPQPRHPPTPSAPRVEAGGKIFISGLPLDVELDAITELMENTVGPLVLPDTFSFYNRAGKSLGMAMVHFAKPSDAVKARTLYNRKIIDQQKPIKVELIGDVMPRNGMPFAPLPPPQPRSLFERLKVPAGQPPQAFRGRPAPHVQPDVFHLQQQNARVIQNQAVGRPQGPPQQYPLGRQRRKKGPKRIQKARTHLTSQPKTVEDLDREMEEYKSLAPAKA